MNKEFEESKNLKETNKEVFEELEQKVQVIKEAIAKIFEKKNQVKEEFYHAKFDYEVEQDEIRHIEYLIRKKEKLVKDEEYKKKREQYEREKLEKLLSSEPNPYIEEISLARALSGYLQKLLHAYKKTIADQQKEVKNAKEE